MQVTKIHQIAAYADDLETAIAFYRDVLGAAFIASYYDPPKLAFFDLDGVRLLLEKGASRTALYLWVDDMDAAYAELRAKGVDFEGEPRMIYRDEAGTFGPPGGEEWMAFFVDPSGNTLALATRKESS